MLNPEVTPEEPVVTEEVKTPEPEAPKELASDKYASFARKEKSIVKARQELSAQKAEFERQRAELQSQIEEIKRFKTLKENAKLDPDAYLKEADLSYGYLTERNLKGGIDPNAVLEKTNQTIAEFKKEQEEARKAAEEANKTQAKKDYEAKVARFVQGIHDFVETNKETYELTQLNESQYLIWEVIQEAGKRGKELSVKEAADKVEDYLAAQIEKSVTSTKKFRDKFAAAKAEEAPKPGTPTINNSMAPSTPATKKHLSDQERITNAMLALNKSLGQQ